MRTPEQQLVHAHSPAVMDLIKALGLGSNVTRMELNIEVDDVARLDVSYLVTEAQLGRINEVIKRYNLKAVEEPQEETPEPIPNTSLPDYYACL